MITFEYIQKQALYNIEMLVCLLHLWRADLLTAQFDKTMVAFCKKQT